MGLYAYEEIAKSLHEVDKAYWSELSKMRVASPYGFGKNIEPGPAPPRLPEHLRATLCNYARQLFQTECNEYPASPQLEIWLTKLAERITGRVLRTVESLNTSLFDVLLGTKTDGLGYHGLTLPEMRQAVEAELETEKARTLARYQPVVEQPSQTAEQGSSTAICEPFHASDPDEERTVEARRMVERRAKLLADYKAATGNPSSKKIYEAENSGINKPEFYEWKNGRLPDRSRTTKQFEAFLTAKRRLIPKKPTT